jgi:NACalpha-BTF3-like transcription factor
LQLWANELLVALRANLVYANLFNRDYEGEIARMGDTVRINGIGEITISNYSKDTDINAPQALTDAQTMLVISQAKYYNFAVDDVDQAQQNPKVMQEAMSRAAYDLSLVIDQYLAGFYTDASASNMVGSSASFVTPVVPTQANVGAGTTVYDYLVVLNQYLDQSLVPAKGRWCVVPPWIKTLLTQDIRWTSFNTPDARQTIASGLSGSGANGDAYMGQIDGMDVYVSVNAPHLGGTVGIAGSQDVVLAGHSMAATYAEGLNKTEAYRPPYRFSDAVKGLALYGAKTVRPQALAAAYLQHP